MTEVPIDEILVEPLGPDSIHWRFVGDWRTSPLAARAIVYQALHPVVAAGVWEHSVFRTDPYGRLDRTLRSVMSHVYGGEEAAQEGRRLQALHRDIKGVDDKGRRYAALNPEAFMWVHATMYENALVFFDLFDTPLSDGEQEELFQEWHRLGLLLGIRPNHLPATREEFWRMWEQMTSRFEDHDLVQYLLHTPPMPPPRVPAFAANPFFERSYRQRRLLIAQTFPDRVRELIGLPEPTEADRREVARLSARMRRAGRLPESLRFVGIPGRARTAALRRHRDSAA